MNHSQSHHNISLANIFNVAHFGIVGDYKEVLPALTAKLKELKSA
jgi:electron transfer flavoprotein alpha subunit